MDTYAVVETGRYVVGEVDHARARVDHLKQDVLGLLSDIRCSGM